MALQQTQSYWPCVAGSSHVFGVSSWSRRGATAVPVRHVSIADSRGSMRRRWCACLEYAGGRAPRSRSEAISCAAAIRGEAGVRQEGPADAASARTHAVRAAPFNQFRAGLRPAAPCCAKASSRSTKMAVAGESRVPPGNVSLLARRRRPATRADRPPPRTLRGRCDSERQASCRSRSGGCVLCFRRCGVSKRSPWLTRLHVEALP